MLITNRFYVKNLLKISETFKQYSLLNRSMAKKIPRGQDPDVVAQMPVLQFTKSDKISSKKRKLIYMWGYCGGGALGRLSLIKRQRFVGRPPPPPFEIKRAPMRSDFVNINTQVIDASAGFGFTVIAAVCGDTSHRLFGCGVNTDSQIGYHETIPGKPLMCLIKPVPIRLPIDQKDKVIRVSCGRSHTVCLTDKGELFSLGDNSFGQCGRPIVENETYFGSRLINQIKNIDQRVIDIVCGQDHTLFLTENGSVYACGWGADGQTGLGHFKNTGIPTLLRGDIENEKITHLSSAIDCTLAINDKGDVFGWGNSEYSQFDCITQEKQLNIPRHLKFSGVNGNIISAAAGGSLCALVNDLGQVYVWGYGILGHGPKVTELRTPTMLPMPLFGCNEFNPDVKVVKIEANLNHLGAITNNGNLYMWGKNRKACLGLGNESDQFFPLRVCVPAIVKKVSLGIDHTVMIGTTII